MVDPITATALAIGGLVGTAGAALASGGSATPTPTPPAAPPPTAPPVQTPQGSAQPQAAPAPSFVGASAVPQQLGYGQKTLLGQ